MGSANRGLNLLIGGWNVATAFRYSVPTPVRLSSTNTLASALFTRDRRVNQTGQGVRGSASRGQLEPDDPNARWFAPVFANPAQFAFGTAASYHDDFRQPRQLSENLAISKNFSVLQVFDHDIRLRYRADFFNMFNRVAFNVDQNFQSPNFGRATGPNLGSRIITMGLMAEF